MVSHINIQNKQPLTFTRNQSAELVSPSNRGRVAPKLPDNLPESYGREYYINNLRHNKGDFKTIYVGAGYEGFQIKSDTYNQIKKYATDKDIKRVAKLCQDFYKVKTKDFNSNKVKSYDWQKLANVFFDEVINANDIEKLPSDKKILAEIVRDRNNKLDANWHLEPWYYMYPQYFGTKTDDVNSRSDFGDVKQMLDYLDELGIKNIYMLPFYEDGGGDNGYDVKDFKPDETLAGKDQKKYTEFMKEAAQRGFRVASDLPFNHVSTEHEWFKKALEGNKKYLDYFIHWDKPYEQVEKDCHGNGDIFINATEPDGKTTSIKAIFSDVDSETFWLKRKVGNKDKYFFKEFYPFQVDLNLKNPDVLKELFHLVGEETNQGILGKRLDAIVHWVKQSGTTCNGRPETHMIMELIKNYTKLVCPKSIILPEVVLNSDDTNKYFGEPVEIGKSKVSTTKKGDAIFNFELQGVLREMLIFPDSTRFWNTYEKYTEKPETAAWLNLLEHHDEVYNGFLSEKERPYLLDTLQQRGGIVYKPKNDPERPGLSTGIRIADALRENPNDAEPKPERMSLATFVLYMMPGTPVMYFGTEIGTQNNYEHVQKAQLKQYEVFNNLLGKDSIPFDKCQDPRELMRGPIASQTFKDKLKEKYLPLETLKKLNKLREQRPALRDSNIEPIINGDRDSYGKNRILSMVRKSDDGKDSILSIANMSGEKVTAYLPVKQLKSELGIDKSKAISEWALEGLNPRLGSSPWDSKEDYLLITLEPYQCMLADKDKILL